MKNQKELLAQVARLELHCRRILDTPYVNTGNVFYDMSILNELVTDIPEPEDDDTTNYPELASFIASISDLSSRAALYLGNEAVRLSGSGPSRSGYLN